MQKRKSEETTASILQSLKTRLCKTIKTEFPTTKQMDPLPQCQLGLPRYKQFYPNFEENMILKKIQKIFHYSQQGSNSLLEINSTEETELSEAYQDLKVTTGKKKNKKKNT